MDLKTYLETTTQSDLARRLGVTQALISHWLTGKTRISAERCVEIERVTEGAVMRFDLRPDLFSGLYVRSNAGISA